MQKYILIFLTSLSLIFSSDSFADDKATVKEFVTEFGNKAIKIASNKDTSIDIKRSNLIELVDSIVDSNWVAKFVLAKNYRSATKEQRISFQKLYRDFMIYTYAPSFKSYNGETFEVLEILQQGKYFMVKCNFIPNKGPKINIAFRIKKNKDKKTFSVLDIVAEGVSLIETQRSEFNSVISKKGMDGFLQDLSQRVKKLKSQEV